MARRLQKAADEQGVLLLPLRNGVPIEKIRKHKYDNKSFCFSAYIDYEDTRRIGMNKKVLIVILTCILFIGIIIIVYYAVGGKKPFKDLEPSEIVSATVRLTPPDTTIQIEEMEELAGYLKDVVIYNEDNSYTEYSGQGVIFTLRLSDGTQTEIMEYNPFFVIDGVGYKTKYEPCQALSAYANRLLNDENANIILEEPPGLTVISDETAFDTLLGTYVWQKRNSDGTSTETQADSPHPLDCEDWLFKFETSETTAALNFAENPSSILNIQCWNEKYWNNHDASGENITIDSYEIELKPGGYIYEVVAEWDTEKSGYGGIAHYYFYIQVLENEQ